MNRTLRIFHGQSRPTVGTAMIRSRRNASTAYQFRVSDKQRGHGWTYISDSLGRRGKDAQLTCANHHQKPEVAPGLGEL